MGFFTSLLRLQSETHERREDFATEILGSVFRHHNEVLQDLMKGLGGYWDESTIVDVQTQVTYDRLVDHRVDSRPDMVITLAHSDLRRCDKIFIEAKIDAEAGSDQLQRYAAHLAKEQSDGKCNSARLIYLTARYDPKDIGDVRKLCDTNAPIDFCQIKWCRIYEILRRYESNPLPNPLVSEALRFMEDHKLNVGSTFAPVDMLALTGFSRAKSLMDATLWGVVRERFFQIVGKPQRRASSLTHYANRERYTIFNNNRGWLVEVGYFMESWRNAAYPEVGIAFRIPRKSKDSAKIEEVLRSNPPIGNGWIVHVDQDYGGRVSFYHTRPLAETLNQSDHVAALTDYFCELLAWTDTLRQRSEKAGCGDFWMPRVVDPKAIDAETAGDNELVEDAD